MNTGRDDGERAQVAEPRSPEGELPELSKTDEGSADGFLRLENVVAGYAGHEVLHDVSLQVRRPGVTALLGPNGAGKTTLLRATAGIIRATSGRISIGGKDVTRTSAHGRVRHGLCDIPEGRGIFPSLTVRENLRLQIRRGASSDDAGRALDSFPELKPHLKQIAGSLSGGQQQMLALSRAYVTRPSIVLLDEVSLGLAPVVIDRIYEVLRKMADDGIAMLLVEQYVTRALDLADHVVLLDRGRVLLDGPTSKMRETDMFSRYLGIDVETASA